MRVFPGRLVLQHDRNPRSSIPSTGKILIGLRAGYVHLKQGFIGSVQIKGLFLINFLASSSDMYVRSLMYQFCFGRFSSSIHPLFVDDQYQYPPSNLISKFLLRKYKTDSPMIVPKTFF